MELPVAPAPQGFQVLHRRLAAVHFPLPFRLGGQNRPETPGGPAGPDDVAQGDEVVQRGLLFRQRRDAVADRNCSPAGIPAPSSDKGM